MLKKTTNNEEKWFSSYISNVLTYLLIIIFISLVNKSGIILK
jgi:hypothetical protein